MSDIVVAAEARESRGKNEAKRLRARGRIPAIVYAPGKENVAVSVSPRELAVVFKTGAAENTLVDLELDGKKRKVILKDYQVHPVRPEFLHADFYEVALDKAIHVKVHIELQGIPIGVKRDGGLLEFVTREIMISCLPLDIPKKFVVDVAPLEIGGEVRVSAVPMPDKVKVLTDGDLLLAHLVTKHADVLDVELHPTEFINGPRAVLLNKAGDQVTTQVLYNPDLKTRWFYVPAVLAMVLMLVTMMLPSMAVVREKEIGTLEQISVTPLRPWQLILGKLTPFAIIGMIDTAVIVVLAQLVFGVPLRGSFLLLLFLTFLFLLNTLGLGLFASTMVATQQQAMMFAVFVLMVPMIYLSGLIFPIENMPTLFQIGSYGIPVRYYGIILRGVFLKGSGLDVLWPEALTLALTGVAWLTFASARFRKRLD